MDQAIGSTANQFDDATPVPAAKDAKAGESASGSSADGISPEKAQVYAGREWTSDHPLNIRMSIPIGVGRYYVTLVAGKERRARARLAVDRRQNPLDKPANVVFLAFVTTIATAGSLTLLYFILAHVFGWSGRLML